jgi:hypothetical protein
MLGTVGRERRGDYEISVVDSSPRKWPSAERLIGVGVPVRIAARWKRERRHFTAGLRRDARENRN